jgi:hypothetical protein
VKEIQMVLLIIRIMDRQRILVLQHSQMPNYHFNNKLAKEFKEIQDIKSPLRAEPKEIPFKIPTLLLTLPKFKYFKPCTYPMNNTASAMPFTFVRYHRIFHPYHGNFITNFIF